MDYKALAQGPFSSLILNLQWGTEKARIIALSSRLKHLDFDSQLIGDEGAKGLASGNLSALTTLDLSYNNIGDEGKEALAKHLHLRLRVTY
mgnify:FL=1